MSRAQLAAWVRGLVGLRALCDLEPVGQPSARQATLRYERTARLVEYLSGLPVSRLEQAAERFYVDWLRRGRTSAIRRAKAKASDRASSAALRAMQATEGPLLGRDVT